MRYIQHYDEELYHKVIEDACDRQKKKQQKD